MYVSNQIYYILIYCVLAPVLKASSHSGKKLNLNLKLKVSEADCDI